MRIGGCILATTILSLAATILPAQTTGTRLAALQTGIACAPPPVVVTGTPDAIHIVAAQAAEPREVLGEQDMIVLSGGAARGMAPGQEYFVRRPILDPGARGNPPHPVQTSGWITVVAVDEQTSIAMVDKSCGPILAGDYIEPFVVPDPPPDAEAVDTTGELDFAAMGRVLYGNDKHDSSSVGQFVLIDQGADLGLAPGARVAVYRDPGMTNVPLVAIGEAKIMSVGPKMALARVNAARTEVRTGDYVVPRK